jgi:S-adenosylmethionine hydrolase
MARRYETISFLSDLGVADETVGVVHAVVRDMAPHARVIDLTHEIAPYDVRGGALALARAIGYLPTGVVLAAVDADERRPIAIEVAGGDGVLLGPDNGVLASAVAMAGGAGRAIVLDRPEYHLAAPATLMAVRDVFAAVAAHLCNGTDLADLGTPVDADALLPGVVPLPRDAAGGGVHAEVLWVDRFGNCQLNVGPDDLAPWGHAEGTPVQLTFGEATDPTVRVAARVATASGLGVGSIGLMIDHTGMLALVLERSSAAAEFGIAVGEQVTIAPLAEGAAATAVPVTLTRR